MKRIIFTLILVPMVMAVVKAQDKADMNKIVLSVVLPDNVEGLEVTQLSKLQTKVAQIVTNSGLSASGYDNNFIIYPKIAIDNSEVVETGMQNIAVVTIELSLFIKQVETKMLFATMSKRIRGSGKNLQAAMTNAIASISPNDAQYKTFIEQGKTKIIQYYDSRCQDLLNKAQNLANIKEYAQAAATLVSIPDAVSCYQKVQAKLVDIYKLYQNKQCVKDLQDAQIEFAANNFKAGLFLLSRIDPSASCFSQVQGVVKGIEAKIDEADKRNWEARMQMYKDAVELEKIRINAIKEVGIAYHKSQTKPSSYNYLIVD